MRNKIASILIIATSLGLGSAAMAQSYDGQLDSVSRPDTMMGTQTSGVITHVDYTDKTVTLADGKTYLLPKGFNAAALLNGQRVALDLEQVGAQVRVRTLQFSAS